MNKIKRYGIILTTIITIFSSSLIVTKAAGTSATIHTLYKTNTLGNAYEYVVISVEFTDYTSGTIIIEVGNLGFYDYIPFGARLSNVYSSGNTRRLTLQVDDCKQAIIYCLPHAGSMVALSPSIYSNDTNYVDHVNQNFIETMFNTTNGYIDDLESQMTTIANYINTSNESLTTINTNLTLMLAKINQLNTDLNQTLGITNWVDMNSAYYTFGGTNTSTSWSAITASGANGYTWTGVQFNQTGIAELPNNLVWIRLPIAKRDRANNVILINGYGNTSNFDDYVYTIVRQTYVDIYIYVPTEYKGRYGDITMLNSVYEYQTSYPATVKTLSVTDDMYWTLISYFEQIKSNNEIIAKLDTLSTDDIVTAINTLPMARIVELLEAIAENTSEDVTQNITNFNANLDIINNVENNFNVDFGTHNEDIDITDINKPEYLETSITGFQTVFTRMFNLHIIKYPILLTLLAAVILILLG